MSTCSFPVIFLKSFGPAAVLKETLQRDGDPFLKPWSSSEPVLGRLVSDQILDPCVGVGKALW